MVKRIAVVDLKGTPRLHVGSVIQVNEHGYETKELSMPCFRCGVCCTRYQVCLSLVEARQIADELGFAWDEWLDRYIDQSWPGAGSLLLRQCKGACVFLEHVEGSNMTRCLIQPFKPSSCREWKPSLYRRECREGLVKYWQLTVSCSGQLEGAKEKLQDFRSFIGSLMMAEGADANTRMSVQSLLFRI